MNGEETRYVVDVSGPLPQVLEERRGASVTRYLYAAGMVASEQDGAWTYQHGDAFGSIRQTTDAIGAVQSATDYDPFGVVIRTVGQMAGSFGYAREQHDAASGLTFLRARYYDPTTGRFLTRDTYPAYAPIPQTLHRYAYVKNNPVNHTDPSGLCFITCDLFGDLRRGAERAGRWLGNRTRELGQTLRHVDRTVRRGLTNLGTSVARGVNNVRARVERGAADWARDVNQRLDALRRDPVQATLNGLRGSTQSVVDFAERKGAELSTAVRQTASAIERGDVGGALQGAGQFLLGATLASDLLQTELGRFALGAGVITVATVATGGAALPVILGGGAFGAAVDYGVQVASNLQRGSDVVDAFTLIDVESMMGSAWHGGVSGAAAELFGLALPVGGGGWSGAVRTAAAEFVGGRGAQVAYNLSTGQAWDQDLGNLLDIALDVVPGVTAAGLRTMRSGRAPAIRGALDAADDNAARVSRRLTVGTLCSFSAATLVATEDGAQPISLLATGDTVLAHDEALGLTGVYTVTAVWTHVDAAIVHLTIDGEPVETTPEHPFYTEERGWVAAGALWLGAHIRSADGSYGLVQAIATVHQPQVMYNLTVAQAHTYFVGQQQWLVHNECDPPIHSRYADGTPVYEGSEPPRLPGATGGPEPLPGAVGAHARLRWDEVNGRLYQAREFDAYGNPVRDIDFTNPTDPSGRVYPNHPTPPNQHRWEPNDPNNLRAGFRRIKRAEPLSELPLSAYDPEIAAAQQTSWSIRIMDRTAPQYIQRGMLTDVEYMALMDARIYGLVTGKWDDFMVVGSHAATPGELLNRELMTQGRLPVPTGAEWRINADVGKLKNPAISTVPTYRDIEFWTPSGRKLPQEFFDFVYARAPSLQGIPRDWEYLRYFPDSRQPPPGIYFGSGGTSRIPAPWGQLPGSRP